MSAPRKTIDSELLLATFDEHAGNYSQTARALGLDRATARRLLRELGVNKPVAGGYVNPPKANKLPLPPKGEVYRYILTCAQNNTYVHGKLLENFKAYAKYFKHCRIMVSRFTYNKAAWHNTLLAKPGRVAIGDYEESLWYDPAIKPFICDDPDRHGSGRYELAPTLHWCAELNIWPTNEAPLSGMDRLAGERSVVLPHTRQEMDSRPRIPSEEPRFLYSTGTVTKMNYIQRKAGQKAEFHHVYGAMIVEVNCNGDWWARQLNADSTGAFYDCPNGQVLHVSNGKVGKGKRPLAINWGDVHAVEIDPEVKAINWGVPAVKGWLGAIDLLKPRYQFMHDLFSCRAQNHHDKSFSVRYEKWWHKQDIMKKEVDETRDLVNYSSRSWCKTIVVASNHHEHGDRWLNDANFKEDLPNAKFFLQAQLARIEAIERNDPSWSFLHWALEREDGGTSVRYLGPDESFKLGPKGRRIEFAMHGHLGPDGARGTLRNIVIVGSGKSNKGHDHKASILQGTGSAGTCQLRFGYMKGPSSHSISHILTYENAKRCMLTQRAGALWANGW